MLVVVCGLPGVGKTTVSEAIADRIGGELLRTDVVRKELFPDPDYVPEETRATYDELFARGREMAADGVTVVLDGTFKQGVQRNRAADLAASLGVEFTLVVVTASETAARERIAARENDESDADFDVYLLLKEQFEPVDRDHVTIDNSGTLDEMYEQIDKLFKPESGVNFEK